MDKNVEAFNTSQIKSFCLEACAPKLTYPLQMLLTTGTWHRLVFAALVAGASIRGETNYESAEWLDAFGY
jgi:hypothetical protein